MATVLQFPGETKYFIVRAPITAIGAEPGDVLIVRPWDTAKAVTLVRDFGADAVDQLDHCTSALELVESSWQ